MSGLESPKALGLPHAEPFVFIDEVVAVEAGKRAVCVKMFSGAEDFFRGHFPGNPLVPGVILTEALAQAAGIAAGRPEGGGSYLLSAIRQMKFLRAVRPGERIELVAEMRGAAGGLLQFDVQASTADGVVTVGGIVLNVA